MQKMRILHDQRGVTLMEVTLAVAIFAGVIGVTAQSLMSFYVSIDMQEQRIEAVATCRSVMDSLREKRYEFKDTFPEDLIAWVEENNESDWEAFLADNSEHVELAGQSIEVACFDLEGNEPGPDDNPIMVQVTTEWLDRKGRPLSATVLSVLTDQ